MIALSPPVLLRAAGTMVVLDVAGPGLPRVLHWGPDLGPLDSDGLHALVAARVAAPVGLDEPLRFTLLPVQSDGWLGRPGLSGHRDGGWPHPRLALTEPVTISSAGAGGSVVARAADPQAGIETRSELILQPQ